jgi:hypothetical protein
MYNTMVYRESPPYRSMTKKLTIKQLHEQCEICNCLDNHLWHGQRIYGTYIAFRLIEDNTVSAYRCDIHYSEEELEEDIESGWEII